MQMQGNFDASGVPPQQGLPKHPPGMFDFQITNTEIRSTNDNTGGMFVAKLTSPAGEIEIRYNLWNASQQAVEIAQKQLSALCHATGVFKLDWGNEGAALRGARGRMEVGPQVKNPEYMEVKRVFDSAGNEPGRAGTAQPQPQPQTQPMTQQPNGGWAAPSTNAPPNAQPPQQANPPQGWTQPNQPAAQPQANATPAQPQPQPQGWQQNNAAPQGGAPPWANR